MTTTAVKKYDSARLSAALRAMTQPGFIESAESVELLEQFELFIAKQAAGHSAKKGHPIEPAEIVTIMVLRLIEQNGRRAQHIASMEKPWGYLARSTFEWVRTERGLETESIDPEGPGTEHGHVEDEACSAITQIVSATFAAIAAVTPTPVLATVKELLDWLAVNPPRRSYEGRLREDAIAAFPSLTKDEVNAVMTIAYGGRPRQADTALFGAFARDPEFQPETSPTHLRAITAYKKAMRGRRTAPQQEIITTSSLGIIG